MTDHEIDKIQSETLAALAQETAKLAKDPVSLPLFAFALIGFGFSLGLMF